MAILVAISLLMGSFFTLVACIGILKLPDLYTRMHATTKAGTVGIGFILLAVGLSFNDYTVTSRVLGTLLFVFITAPIGAHLLGKAMLKKGYPMWQHPDQRCDGEANATAEHSDEGTKK